MVPVFKVQFVLLPLYLPERHPDTTSLAPCGLEYNRTGALEALLPKAGLLGWSMV